jgi:hypothetical protein
MGADGPFVPYWPSGATFWLSPQGGEAPLLPICAHQIARNRGDYGGRNRGVPSRFFPSGCRLLERPSIYPPVSAA